MVLERRVAELEALVRELQARLGIDATNSSMPPSSNPPGARKPVVKRKSKRKPGGQPGHPPHLKQLLPLDRVSDFTLYLPTDCPCCHTALPSEAGPNDPPPTRFQVVELPPVVAQVHEHQGHHRTCPGCGHIAHAPIPREVLGYSVGPRMTAALSYFAGCHGVSKRGVEEIAAAVFDAPVSLGTVSNLEQEVSAALEAAHAEAVAAVRAAPVKHADETSWKERGRLRWLWAAASAKVAAFKIHVGRGRHGMTALLGTPITGILCSDRWHTYNQVPAERRQICWAHLKRDFQKLIDRGGPGEKVGRAGQKIVQKVFAAWHAYRDEQRTREQLQEELVPVVKNLQRVLLEGWLGDDAKAVAFCANLLQLEEALWTFARVDGVEPTNNFMERQVRRAVLWRKRSFGCWSEAGCRFVERMLTVVQTRRLQGQSVLEYLHRAVVAHRAGLTSPKLLPEG